MKCEITLRIKSRVFTYNDLVHVRSPNMLPHKPINCDLARYIQVEHSAYEYTIYDLHSFREVISARDPLLAKEGGCFYWPKTSTSGWMTLGPLEIESGNVITIKMALYQYV